jgi:acyl carrier protein
MNVTREHLVACFTAVFPRLGPDEVRAATIDSVSDWDSTHHFLLVQVIEEAFGIQIPEEIVGETVSFGGFEAYLAQEGKLS